MIFLIVFISSATFLLCHYLTFFLKWRNGPPGPFPFPVVGNLIQILSNQSGNSSAPLSGLTKIYGDMYRLRIGVKDFVVLSSLDTISHFYNREEALGRDSYFGVFKEINLGQNTGLTTSHGETWKRNRTWTFKMLQKFGHGKDKVDTLIGKECNMVLDNWKNKLGNKSWAEVEVSDKEFVAPISKVTFAPIIGNSINEPKIESQIVKLAHMNADVFKGISSLSAGLEVAFPFLKYICPNLLGREEERHFFRVLRRAAQDHLEDVRDAKYSSPPNSIEPTVIDAYLNTMEHSPKDSGFTDFNFQSIFVDLLQTSGDTTASYLLCVIHECVLHQDWQERIVQEIRNIIRADESVRVEHRHRMPHTEAFLLEVQRTSVLLPNLVPRRIMSEFSLDGCTIPKGTILLPDAYSAHYDTRIWKNPEDFNPSRFFLEGENEICNKTRRQVLTFGSGRRVCPGESVAESMLFIFLISILQNFKLGAIPGQGAPELKLTDGALSLPLPFNIAISKRH